MCEKGQELHSRYVIDHLLGQGGMGKTYLALDKSTGKKVVLKVLSISEMSNWKTYDLFKREITILQTLQHPDIPGYIDHFEEDDARISVLVQEYAEGKSLRQLASEKKRFSQEEIVLILKSLLKTLKYIHSVKPQVIHRDINPNNIIIGRDLKVFLVDFGAARILENRTVSGDTVAGTIGYFAQEQLYGKASPASDLYSLAVTIIFLLTGKEPADLPLKGMRLDYHGFVNIPRDFRILLDMMTEPQNDYRLQEADTALKYLDNDSGAIKEIRERYRRLKIGESKGEVDFFEVLRRKEKKQAFQAISFVSILLFAVYGAKRFLLSIAAGDLNLFIDIFTLFLTICSFIAAYYIFRLFFRTYAGEMNGNSNKKILALFFIGFCVQILFKLFSIPFWLMTFLTPLGILIFFQLKSIKQVVFIFIAVSLVSFPILLTIPPFCWLILFAGAGLVLAAEQFSPRLSIRKKLFLKTMSAGTAVIAGIIYIFTSLGGLYLTHEIEKDDDQYLIYIPYLLGGDTGFRFMDTPLHGVAGGYLLSPAGMLIASGAFLDTPDEYGKTPLCVAARSGRMEMLAFLIKAGAAINGIPGHEEKSPVVFAAISGDIEKVKMLIENGASLDIGTLLHDALLSYDTKEMIALLIENGAPIDGRDSEGNTPLHTAVISDLPVEVVKLLLDAGASLDSKNNNGENPLDTAKKTKQKRTVRFLEEYTGNGGSNNGR